LESELKMEQKIVYWMRGLDKSYLNVVGKKCANLAEMRNKGLPAPPGFAVSVFGYERFMSETGIGQKINGYLQQNYGTDKLKKASEAEAASAAIRKMIEDTPMPEDMEREIIGSYTALCRDMGREDIEVAVRSSGAISMPGQFETYLYVRGVHEVVKHVIRCWSSTFTPRAIMFRAEKGLNVGIWPIGVAVIKMVNAKASGVMFTLNPVTGDRSKITIEANWGLGESVVSGRIEPDRFKINKITLEIEEKRLGRKEEEYIYDSGKRVVEFREVSPERRSEFCLTDEEIIKLVNLGKQAEKLFGGEPQDIEWAIDKDLPPGENTLLLQSRPETIWASKQKKDIPHAKSALDYITTTLMEGKKLK